ncbi:MAG: hypothetical protein HRT44_08485 [Bdellovibrionales bacterium]|nr:hypothetical protein [Bdellovibrionales bacterium]NQZ19277.1 hypothetical protein [Bdellovibrionales bacterium]
MKYSNHEYYNYLVSMGDFYPLHIRPSETTFLSQIKAFEKDWKPYNPRTENKRFGLSLTSLDGGMNRNTYLD